MLYQSWQVHITIFSFLLVFTHLLVGRPPVLHVHGAVLHEHTSFLLVLLRIYHQCFAHSFLRLLFYRAWGSQLHRNLIFMWITVSDSLHVLGERGSILRHLVRVPIFRQNWLILNLPWRDSIFGKNRLLKLLIFLIVLLISINATESASRSRLVHLWRQVELGGGLLLHRVGISYTDAGGRPLHLLFV